MSCSGFRKPEFNLRRETVRRPNYLKETIPQPPRHPGACRNDGAVKLDAVGKRVLGYSGVPRAKAVQALHSDPRPAAMANTYSAPLSRPVRACVSLLDATVQIRLL